MKEGGVIGSTFCRHPIAPMPEWARDRLFELLRPLDPVALNWGR